MLELKTIDHKVDHPLLTLPEAAALPEAPVSREPKQRRMMLVALALLLMALGGLIYRDRDFWFPDAPEAEDQLEPAPQTAVVPAAAAPVTKATTPEKAPEKKPLIAKAHAKIQAPVAPAVATPAPPPAATATRTVLPPLEIEVVAGDNHSKAQPKTNAVHVDLQPGAPPRAVASAATSEPSAASVTNKAAEHVQLAAGQAEVIGQPVKPGYPMLARQMKVQGSVILQALIGRDGGIQSLHVVSGPPILATAAQEAVRQWRFKPHYQGSEAIETQANITVNFTISTN